MEKCLYSLDFHHCDHFVELWHERYRQVLCEIDGRCHGSFNHDVLVLHAGEWYRLGARVSGQEEGPGVNISGQTQPLRDCFLGSSQPKMPHAQVIENYSSFHLRWTGDCRCMLFACGFLRQSGF